MTTQKTPEEIKNSLERCGQNAECSKCAYYKKHDILYTCMDSLLPDALALIEQLERERDAAIADVKESDVLYECEHCAHTIRGADCDKCEEVYFDCEKCEAECKCKSCRNGSNWEWRGVEEEKDEKG